MFEVSGRLQACLDGILVVQRLKNTDHCRRTARVLRGEPCGAALTAQQLAQSETVERLSFNLVTKRHVHSSPWVKCPGRKIRHTTPPRIGGRAGRSQVYAQQMPGTRMARARLHCSCSLESLLFSDSGEIDFDRHGPDHR